MRILLVNVDSRWNMAIRKMFNYYRQNHKVDMIDLRFSGYPHKRKKVIDGAGYDKVFVIERAVFSVCSAVTLKKNRTAFRD